MVIRTRFFVASLWAPLPPIGLMAAGCLWIILFPETPGLSPGARHVAGIALIAVPFIYTALFGVSYVAARLLHGATALSRLTLFGVAGVASLLLALLVTLTGRVGGHGILTFAVTLLLSLASLSGSVLVWWRKATTGRAVPPPPYVKGDRTRHRASRSSSGSGSSSGSTSSSSGSSSRREAAGDHASTELVVRWNPDAQRLLILHPDQSRFPAPLAEVDNRTLEGLSPAEASKHVGELLTGLLPGMRGKNAGTAASRGKPVT